VTQESGPPSGTMSATIAIVGPNMMDLLTYVTRVPKPPETLAEWFTERVPRTPAWGCQELSHSGKPEAQFDLPNPQASYRRPWNVAHTPTDKFSSRTDAVNLVCPAKVAGDALAS
jgi:hypothetical protein